MFMFSVSFKRKFRNVKTDYEYFSEPESNEHYFSAMKLPNRTVHSPLYELFLDITEVFRT